MLNKYDVVLIIIIFMIIKLTPNDFKKKFKFNSFSFDVLEESIHR